VIVALILRNSIRSQLISEIKKQLEEETKKEVKEQLKVQVTEELQKQVEEFKQDLESLKSDFVSPTLRTISSGDDAVIAKG